MCQDLRDQYFVAGQQVDCWLENFDTFLKDQEGKRLKLPLDPKEFHNQVKQFAKSPLGSYFTAERMLVIRDDRIKFMEFKATSIGK